MHRTLLTAALLATLLSPVINLTVPHEARAAEASFGIRLEIRSPVRVHVGAPEAGELSGSGAVLAPAVADGQPLQITLPAGHEGTAEVLEAQPVAVTDAPDAASSPGTVTILLQ